MKKIILTLASLFLLSSCQNKSQSHALYYGYAVGFKTSETLSEASKPLQLNSNEITGDYRYEYTFLYQEEDLLAYQESHTLTTEQKKKLTFTDDDILFVISFFVPQGYEAYLRRNIQFMDKTLQRERLVTPSFYTYPNRKELSFCFIDLLKDESITQDYTYTEIYHLPKYWEDQTKKTKVRGILTNETAKETLVLPQEEVPEQDSSSAKMDA